ncbi:hypothetical protein CEXT_426661 [Caerostris extrusa]|uniref:Uncharacterized protein n=1 Tax=Caerostris extrusa TaxID=172846 RepID=A0AAV4NLE5_CAEEX|nr:hypothetical protein CEXT_426661 [Caerostris extrusa]
MTYSKSQLHLMPFQKLKQLGALPQVSRVHIRGHFKKRPCMNHFMFSWRSASFLYKALPRDTLDFFLHRQVYTSTQITGSAHRSTWGISFLRAKLE